MRRNFTRNNAKNVKNVKNGRLAPPSADSKSISSISSINSTTSITTQKKRTSFVAVTETKSVVTTKAGETSGPPNSLASRNDPSASSSSVSQSKSVTIEDTETSATKEEVIVIRTDQAKNIPSEHSERKTFARVRDSKNDLQESESRLKSTTEGKLTSETVDENALARPKNAGSTKSIQSNGKAHKNNVLGKNKASLDFVRSGKEAAKEDIVIKEINLQLDSDECLYYVHNWDENSSVSGEMAASVSEMEIILSKELVRRFKNYKSDSSSDSPIFYHDHQNGHKLVHVSKNFHIEPNRQDLLRVIGCGHFLLSYFSDAISYAIEECRKVDNLDWAVSFLTSVRSEWERSALNKLTPCDEAVGIGNYFNDLASRWLALNVDHHSCEELQQWLDLNAVKFMCTTMCFSDQSQDLVSTYRSAYKEFLFLHMACIVDHDEPENIDPKLLKQFMLLNRKSEMIHLQKVPKISPLIAVTNRPAVSADANKPLRQQQAGKAVAVKASESAAERCSTASGRERNHKNARRVVASLAVPSHPTKGRQQPPTPPTLGLGSASNTQLWKSYDPFEATNWFESDDGRTIKVAEQHWKLGCKGCPGGMQELASRDEKSQRRRKCKWVTIKRTVLAKRSVSKESCKLAPSGR